VGTMLVGGSRKGEDGPTGLETCAGGVLHQYGRARQ
jgi:hypothetical protein